MTTFKINDKVMVKNEFTQDQIEFIAAKVQAPAPAMHSTALAGLILTHLGYSTEPSLEPGADMRRDALARRLGEWLSPATQAPGTGERNMSDPWDDGYNAAQNGRTWFSCPYSGRDRQRWLDGYSAFRQDRKKQQQ